MGDEERPVKRVVRYTIIASTASAIGTGIYGAFKHSNGRSPGFLAASAALNTGIASATFFSIREYAVTPALASALPLARMKSPEIPSDSLTWSALRMNHLLDTCISGGITGGLLHSIRAGVRGILPGTTTGAFACTLLQLLYNEVGILRLKWVARSLGEFHQAEPVPPSTFERIFAAFGLQKLSDDAYLTLLKQSRARYIARINQLQVEMEREEAKEKRANYTDSNAQSRN